MMLSFIILSHQLERRTYLGTRVSVDRANTSHQGLHLGIVNMPAIPGQQIIHVVYDGQRNVQGIISRRFRQSASVIH